MALPPEIEDSPKVDSAPLPVDLSANAPAMSRLDANYLAAMATADAVFGKKPVEVTPLQEPPNDYIGRILPCLLQPEAEPASPPEQAKKARRGPRAVKPLEQKAFEDTAIASPLEPAAATKAVGHSPVVVIPDLSNAAASRRERSAIQNRWVRKTELMPGEKWKQRLCRAAR